MLENGEKTRLGGGVVRHSFDELKHFGGIPKVNVFFTIKKSTDVH